MVDQIRTEEVIIDEMKKLRKSLEELEEYNEKRKDNNEMFRGTYCSPMLEIEKLRELVDLLEQELAECQRKLLHRPTKQRKYEHSPLHDDPLQSPFYLTYLDPKNQSAGYHDPSGHRATLFRNSFRMPFSVFEHLLNTMEPFFPRTLDCIGKESTPLGLLLLGALSFMGNQHSFLGLKAVTNVSAQTNRDFFRKFVRWGREHLYPKYVKQPETPEEFAACMNSYTELGFPGTVCSVDATHVELHACADSSQVKTRGRSGRATMVFEICVSFDRRILHSTTGFPGTVNDKTIAKNDEFLKGLRDNRIGKDITWYTYNEKGDTVAHVGYLHAICDGGYPPHGNLICASSSSSDPKVVRWSNRLGKIRKDVECCFGSLKKRFSMFKTGWNSPDLEMLDDAWLTCCALHNMLLDSDAESIINQSLEKKMDKVAGNVDKYPSHGLEEEEVEGTAEDDILVIPGRDSLEKRRSLLVTHFDELGLRKLIKWVDPN